MGYFRDLFDCNHVIIHKRPLITNTRDNHLRLVMVVVALCCTRQSRAPTKVKVHLHTEYQGRRSNGSAMIVRTDGRTDRRMDATKHIISLLCSATHSIK